MAPEASGAHGDIRQVRSDVTAGSSAIGWRWCERGVYITSSTSRGLGLGVLLSVLLEQTCIGSVGDNCRDVFEFDAMKRAVGG